MTPINIRCCRYFFAVIIISSACNDPAADQYSRLVKKELAKGVRYDSLFLGISFGMTRKNFYDHCWQLNKKGIMTDGLNSTMVLYKINGELKHPATVNFYPDFYQEKIFHMRVIFEYDGWAPWNKDQFSDSLLTDVTRLYKKWYAGNEFIRLVDKTRGIIYVKVDGNRRIIAGKFDDALVHVDYTDLLIEKKLNKKE